MKNLIKKWIAEFNMAIFKEKISRLKAKAEQMGISLQVEITSERRTIRTENNNLLTQVAVLVDATSPVLAGWRFLAVLEPLVTDEGTKILVKAVPGVEIPTSFHSSDFVCEHCQTNRQRSSLFLVQHETTGELKKVGSSCLRDFLGHDSPAEIANRYFTLLERMEDQFGFYELTDAIEAAEYGILSFLSHVHAEAKSSGWVSQAKAAEGFLSTAVGAWDRVTGYRQRFERKPALIHDEDAKWATEALSWVKSTFSPENNFGYNLKIATARDTVNNRTFGIVAALYPVYERYKADLERATSAPSDYFGQVKKRDTYKLRVLAITTRASDFGCTWIHSLVDENGNRAVWFASTNLDLKEGQEYQLKATVKAHEEYRGRKQTVLTRCALAS